MSKGGTSGFRPAVARLGRDTALRWVPVACHSTMPCCRAALGRNCMNSTRSACQAELQDANDSQETVRTLSSIPKNLAYHFQRLCSIQTASSAFGKLQADCKGNNEFHKHTEQVWRKLCVPPCCLRARLSMGRLMPRFGTSAQGSPYQSFDQSQPVQQSELLPACRV